MHPQREKWMNLLMAANGLLFVGMFLGIGLFNRPSADDFHYMALVQEHGAWDAMLLHYHHWNPRWASTLVVNGFFAKWQDGVTLPLLHLLTMVLGWSAFALLLRMLMKKMPIKFVHMPFYALAGLFYVSFGMGDTWYWLCSVPMYLWGVLAFFLGFGLLLLEGGLWWRIPLVAGVFLYIGGSSEPVAVCVLILLIYFGVTQQDGHRLGIFHVATIACLTGLIIDAMGSGAQVRMEHLPQLPLTNRLWISLTNYGRLLVVSIPQKLPALLVFMLPVAWMGLVSEQFQSTGPRELMVKNRHMFAVADLMVIALSLMMGLLMSDMGPDRAWLPISALVLMTGLIIAYQMGTWLDARLRGRLFHASVLAQVLLLGYQVQELTTELPRAMAYANAVDARMQTIVEAVERGETLLALSPLPDAGWLQSAEITADTSHHRNRHLSLHFGNEIQLFVGDPLSSASE
jgi:hypothetical protein